MRKFLLAAALISASTISTGAAMASEVQVTSVGPVIDLTVTETVKATPDIAKFSTGVQNLAPTANQAIQQNNVQMTAVIAKLKKLGIADKDIQTTQINLSQSFDYVDGQQRFKGFQASNMVMVTLRDLKKLGAFLDALASDGATNFDGPNFSVDDDSKLVAAARDKAWATGMARAMLYGKKSGYSNVQVIRVIEEAESFARPVQFEMAANAVGRSVKQTPIAPGEVSTGVSLSFTFEMVK